MTMNVLPSLHATSCKPRHLLQDKNLRLVLDHPIWDRATQIAAVRCTSPLARHGIRLTRKPTAIAIDIHLCASAGLLVQLVRSMAQVLSHLQVTSTVMINFTALDFCRAHSLTNTQDKTERTLNKISLINSSGSPNTLTKFNFILAATSPSVPSPVQSLARRSGMSRAESEGQ